MAELAAVRAIVDEFASAAQLPADERARLHVVLDELVTNLAKYGYPAGATGFAEIELSREGDSLVLEFSDGGAPFDPFQAQPPLLEGGAGERDVGGLGLHLIRSLADSLSYDGSGGRNRLRFVRHLAGRRL